MSTVQLKRGLRKNLPSSLACGELAFCTDTKELFIGTEGEPEVLMYPEVLVNRTVLIHTSRGYHVCVDPVFKKQVLQDYDKKGGNLAYLISTT